MAERFIYQYQPITGPVWREPVAEKLAWMPSARQPARVLPRMVPFDWSLYPLQPYNPSIIEWMPYSRQPSRVLPRMVQLDWSVYPLQPPVPYDPSRIEWMPSARQPARVLQRMVPFDWSLYPIQVTSVYDPRNLEWMASDRYRGTSAASRAAFGPISVAPVIGSQMIWQYLARTKGRWGR